MDNKNNSYKNYSQGVQPSITPIADDVRINLSSSCTPIPTSEIVNLGYEFSESNIIPNESISGSFFQSSSLVEFFAYDSQKNLISTDYNFTDWSITDNSATIDVPTPFTNNQGINVIPEDVPPIPSNEITLDPSNNLYNKGFDNGELYAFYNFINYELASTTNQTYYISDISGDRTEIRLKSNTIPSEDIVKGYQSLKAMLESSEYFDEFYVGLFKNNYSVGINVLLEEDESTSTPSILVKLFQPLPPEFTTEQEVYVVTKVGESVAYKVEFIEDFRSFIDNANFIKGPNINIGLQDLVNNSTTLKSYEDLTKTKSSQSLDSVLNKLNQTGVTITPDYSYNTFSEFINFSSAEERINNFYEKISQLQAYQADIDTITTITGSNPNVSEISQSLASLQTNITNLVENFDGYENYLYHNSSSFAYPKTGSAYPFSLLSTGSNEVLTWLGSLDETSEYYGGYRLSASLYDENNQNWLYYTIPSFITENSNNKEYTEFSNMVGQSFDEVWLYTKALSERYNTTNNPDTGLPLDLAADAIKGLGFETFGNNYDNQDNFIGLTGEDDGSYVPPTGSELITQYIAINSGSIISYWTEDYSWVDYVQQITDPGFPYAIDKVSKEIYKRLYHNMAYLTKKKGTISGLRQLINIWGIPNTILRINEFGGKNRDNIDDYDLWYKRYSYAYTPVGNSYQASSSVKVPWMPLERNYIADNNEYIVPDGVAFRFKTTGGSPTSRYAGSFYSQSLAVKKSNGVNDTKMDWGISLFYEDQPSGSYSGSSFSDYYNYGKLRFYISASSADGGVQVSNDLELPFFDGGWWSILLQRNQHTNDNSIATTYTLFAANKQSDGWDGNSIGWTGSISLDSTSKLSMNTAWNSFGVTENDGVYVGGYISGSNIGDNVSNEFGKIFSGSFQEFRYYSNNISESIFNDFVMNPESVEGVNITGSKSSFDIVNFRAPLGNELEYVFTASEYGNYVENVSSSHPSITGSAPSVITASFINPATSAVTSSYEFIHYSASTKRTYSKTGVETYFLDQPAVGIRNRISNKIQVEDGDDYGTVLSQYRSINQNYLISQSYTEDITSLEVGFSPQDEVNDDIIATYGYGVISDTLADPRFAFEGTTPYYPKLRQVAQDYFKKYTEGSVWDYIRLIKYFDNSIFKAIKAYVPARTSVTTGVIVKQHMLERNRRQPVRVNPNTIIAYTPETGSIVGGQSTATGMNSPISYRDLEITGSINMVTVEGGAGGVVNLLNVVTQSLLNSEVTQSWVTEYDTISGSVYVSHSSQDEFYNGEFSGSTIVATTQSLLNNPFAESGQLDSSYKIAITSSDGRYSVFDPSDIYSTYPSYSIAMEVYSHANNEFNVGFNVWDGWEDQNPNSRLSGSVFIVQDSSDNSIWYINGFILPTKATSLGVSNTFVSTALGQQLGVSFGQTDDILSPRVAVPVPPIPPQGFDDLKNGLVQYNQLGPYIKMDISGSINPTFNADNFLFEVNSDLDSLYTNNIISLFLGNSGSITPNVKLVTTKPGQADSYTQFGAVKYWITDPENNGGARIIMNQPIAQGPDSGNDNLFRTFTNIDVYVSQYDQTIENSFNAINGTSAPDVSSGSLSLVGTTWTGFYGDNGSWAPTQLVFNNKNADVRGNIVNNQTTLINRPNFNFNINTYTGIPASSDVFGLSGSYYEQSYNPILNSLQIINGNNLNSQGYAYLFDVGGSRPQSGSISASNSIVTATCIPEGTNPGFGQFMADGVGNQLANTDFLVLDNISFPWASTLAGGPNSTITIQRLTNGQTAIVTPTSPIASDQPYPGSTKINVDSFTGINIQFFSGESYKFTLNQNAYFLPSGSQLTQFVNFDPQLPLFEDFYNTPFNPLINNVSNNRKNTYVEVIEYDNGPTPSNIQSIIDNTAEKAAIPDSFYTMKRSIIPRYLGSKLQSANYNTFTEVGTEIAYLNNVSGSTVTGSVWSGDSLPSIMSTLTSSLSTISKHPIYFAHFKSSKENYELWDTYTFRIDNLIECPLEDISGDDAPLNPVVIKIDGSGDNLTDVRSTFEVDRKALIAYTITSTLVSGSKPIDYTSLPVGSDLIYQGALEYQTINTSAIGRVAYTVTQSFVTSSWASIEGVTTSDTPPGEYYLQDLESSLLKSSGSAFHMITGSSVGSNEDALYLKGGLMIVSASAGVQDGSPSSQLWWGPGLAVTHNYNQYVERGLVATGSYDPNVTADAFPGIPRNQGLQQKYSGSNPNYIYLNYDQSINNISESLNSYENFQQPFIIKKGDEIRVSYSSIAGSGVEDAVEVDFTVTDVSPNTDYENGIYPDNISSSMITIDEFGGITTYQYATGSIYNYDKIRVTPPPSSLDIPIPEGKIYNFTIRRRTNADDRVIMFQTAPTGSDGINTPSPSGFLIPNDFTQQQKRNVQTIINQLSAKNAFRASEDSDLKQSQ